MFLSEKLTDAARDDRTDVLHVEEVFFGCCDNIRQIPEMGRQACGRRFTYLPNAQGKQKLAQGMSNFS